MVKVRLTFCSNFAVRSLRFTDQLHAWFQGYTTHIVHSFSEWILVFSFAAYFLAMALETRRYSLRVPVVDAFTSSQNENTQTRDESCCVCCSISKQTRHYDVNVNGIVNDAISMS